MGKKGCEVAVEDQAILVKANALLGALWQGVQEGLEQDRANIQGSGRYPDSLKEAEVAMGLVDEWQRLSGVIVQNPKSLTLRSCELTRTQKLVETNLVNQDGAKVVLQTKYSVVKAIVDSRRADYRFAAAPEEGTPQLEVDLVEMFEDSLRDARAAMSGTLSSQADVGFNRSPESKCGQTASLGIEAFAIGRIAARRLSLTGKTTWYDTDDRRIRTWNLAGYQLNEAVDLTICPFDVKKTTRLDRSGTQFELHPISYDHGFLEGSAPALFAAVEPFAKMVQKHIEKSKR